MSGEVEVEANESTRRRIEAIWSEVLNRPSLPENADFLELGGDSLQVMRMLARVARAFDTSVSIEAFFLDPTVDALCQRVLVSSQRGDESSASRVHASAHGKAP